MVWSDRKSQEKMELLKTSTRLWAPKNIFQKRTERERENGPAISSHSQIEIELLSFPLFFWGRDSYMQNLVCRLSSVMRNAVRQLTAAWFPLHTVTINDGEQKQDEEKRERERQGCNVSTQTWLSNTGLWVGIHMLSFKMTNQNNTRFIYPAVLDRSFLHHGFYQLQRCKNSPA